MDDVLKTIIAEGAGEGEDGMFAIASAIVNRAARRRLSLTQVVNQPKQFTGRWRADLDTFVQRQGPQVEAQARRALQRAQQTPMAGVDHYLTRDLYESPNRPSWAGTMGGHQTVGRHVFLNSRAKGGTMPTLKEMTLEGPEVQEKIVKELHRMDRNIQAMGLGPMSPEELRHAHGKIKTAVAQVVMQPEPGAMPAAAPARPPMGAAPPMDMRQFAEGGLINDQSGQATQQIRNRLGIR
jgi:cell wall hydrolase